MTREVARLVPLHQAPAPFYQLPEEGSVTIGRRANCTVVLSDGAVSGLHCLLHCLGVEPLSFRVEDRSTNGVFINEVRVTKGERGRLVHGNVLSLGKAVEDCDGAAAGIRPQFRLEVQQQERSLELLGQPSATSRELRSEVASMDASAGAEGLTAPTSLDNQSAKPSVVSSGTFTAEGFAQDLLVQEQRSKAKITGELLLVRRRLDEERAARETLDREVRKARTVLEDERARHALAQAGLERLQTESAQLRLEHGQLKELQEKHAALETKHEKEEVDLGALLQKTATLDAGQEHLRLDWQRASSDEVRVKAQLAEAQARLQQVQERTESLHKRHLEARRSAEVAQESVEQWQRELSNERTTREQLDDQVALLNADVERACDGERVAKEARATMEAQQADLQSQLTVCREEAIASRSRAKEARERLERDSQQAECVRGAGGRFVEALRAYADCWARGLAEGGQSPAGGPRSHSAASSNTVRNAVVCRSEAPPFVDVSAANVAPCVEGAEVAADAEVSVAAVASNDGASNQGLRAVTEGSPVIPAASTGKDEAVVRPPVPLWEPPTAVGITNVQEAVTPMTAGGVRGQQHGMASLMVGSQDSPPLPAYRSPEKGHNKEVGCEEDGVSRVLKLEAAVSDVSSVQRLATASILTLVSPPSKRPMQLHPAAAGRKRLRAR